RDRFAYARWEFKRGSPVCEKYDVDRAPTILILDAALEKPQEKPLARITGSRTPRELRRDLEAVVGAVPDAPGATIRPNGALLPPPRQEPLSDDEVDRKFIQARITVARDLVERNMPQKAIEVLEDVVQSFPKHVETKEAVKLLEKLKKK